MNRKEMERRLGRLEEIERPEQQFPDWLMEDQLESVADKLVFYRRFHGDGRVRYPATDRELHLLGLLCAREQQPGGVGEHRFPSGAVVSWRDNGDGTPSVSTSGYVRLEDLPEGVREYFKRMDPAEQPEREKRLYELWRVQGGGG